jgi:hypothetical protein
MTLRIVTGADIHVEWTEPQAKHGDGGWFARPLPNWELAVLPHGYYRVSREDPKTGRVPFQARGLASSTLTARAVAEALFRAALAAGA